MQASPARSPSAGSQKSAKEKRAEEMKIFTLLLKTLVQNFNALVVLNTALGQAGKGAFLAFPDPRNPQMFHPFNRKHVRSANAKFSKEIMELKAFLRNSRKKVRAPAQPGSFSSVFTPIYAGEALRTFLTAAPERFGYRSPIAGSQDQNSPILMDSLPYVRAGYFLRNTITMLFYIYAHVNSLQDPNNAQFARSDEIMNRAFGGTIPATYYAYRDPATGKPTKILMSQAVQQGIPAMNTYDMISAMYPVGTLNKDNKDASFNPERFNTYFFQNIAAANYYSKSALAEAGMNEELAELNKQNVAQSMLNEHNLVKQVSVEWHEILGPQRKAIREQRKREKDAAKAGRA